MRSCFTGLSKSPQRSNYPRNGLRTLKTTYYESLLEKEKIVEMKLSHLS